MFSLISVMVSVTGEEDREGVDNGLLAPPRFFLGLFGTAFVVERDDVSCANGGRGSFMVTSMVSSCSSLQSLQ